MCLLSFGICYPQSAEVRPADFTRLPGVADSNSPSYWSRGKLYAFNSDGMPVRSEGGDLFQLSDVRAVMFFSYEHVPLWIEAVWAEDADTVYAWYHHEPFGECGEFGPTAPQIGALVSGDGGRTFRDLGIVLASGAMPDCGAENGYFAGGNGDFTVIPDSERQYFYFFFSNYGGAASGQGVAVARMPFSARAGPAGSVWKFHRGNWNEPGIGGDVTPIFPVHVPWNFANTDAFWGPSVHYNTFLETFVMVLNRSCCEPGWPPAGTWISYNPDPSDPEGWSRPEILFEGGGWYPMIVGLGPDGTDKLAGEVARLFIGSGSDYEVVFKKQASATESRSRPRQKSR